MSGIFRIFVGYSPTHIKRFCHVGKLSYLCMMRDNKTILLKTPIVDMTLSRLRKLSAMVMVYCIGKLGTHRYKPIPKVSIIYNVDAKYYGMFECGKNTIVINRAYSYTIKLFIQTVIHEYTHYLQNMNEYKQLYKKVGYDKHPYEMESRENEKLYKEVFKHIKQLI